MSRIFIACAVLVAGAAVADEPQIQYEFLFDATWSAATHPQDFPPSAHFSPPIGAVHNAAADFWSEGELATLGIQHMAEVGATVTLGGEIADEAALGNAAEETILGFFIFSPGLSGDNFVTTSEFPLVTLVTMIAPSPDWFLGTDSYPLLRAGRWRDNVTIDMYPYDAGTDSGPTFASPNQITVPQAPITRIVTPPLATNGHAPPMGTYQFRILDVDGRPPYEDLDGDGLTNLREAELGSDPTLEDTDSDSVLDPDDNCPTVANSTQLDDDADGAGNSCDNCTGLRNSSQSDRDGDGQGDRCDLDDGTIELLTLDSGSVTWQNEAGVDSFNLYRADLAVLRGGGPYTQDPAAPEAARTCGLTGASASDGYTPSPGEAVYFLVTGVTGGVEGTLGPDAQGDERPNDNAC